jgi:hypothetical protein
MPEAKDHLILRAAGGYYWGGYNLGWTSDVTSALGFGKDLEKAEAALRELQIEERRMEYIKGLEFVCFDAETKE